MIAKDFEMSNTLNDFTTLAAKFESGFSKRHFPDQPHNLYDAAQHLLSLKGKRIRPVLCLMASELFGPISDDAYLAATAIELFHNFTLVHDDIMDRAPLRRGQPTVHEKFGSSSAILAGDVMLIQSYQYLNSIAANFLPKVISLFNATAAKVCEGQQLDMEFESRDTVSIDEYVGMISLKTSVLLAASLQMGSILGGAGLANQELLYDFGKNLGIAFQIQDDYLDAFGDPEKVGKQTGGDIIAGKKTFLLLRAKESAGEEQLQRLNALLASSEKNKVDGVLEIYRSCGVDQWAEALKAQYSNRALEALEEVAVMSKRKQPLRELASILLNRQF